MSKIGIFIFVLSYYILSCQNHKTHLVFSSFNNQIDTISRNDTLLGQLIVYNKLGRDVVFNKLVSSCGCTVISNNVKQVIYNTDSLVLEVKYVPDPLDSGLIEKKMIAHFDYTPSIYPVSFKVFVKK